MIARRMRRASLIAGAAACALILGACTAAPEGPVQTDRPLVLGLPFEIDSIDPHTSSSTSIFQVTGAIYDTLLIEDLRTETKSSPEILPGLAESWEMSEDGLTYEFKIRSGVKFHDGTDLNAEAVKINFDRFVDESSPIFSETARGATGQLNRWIESTSFDGEDTFIIQLTSRFSGLPQALTNRQIGIISPAALQTMSEEELASNAVGTGPFKTEGIEIGQRIELERNDDYWGGTVPLARLIFVMIPDASTMATALQTGDVDVILTAGAEQVAQLQGLPNVVVQYPDPANQYFVRLNADTAPTDNQLFRQALNFAIDREGLAAVNNGLVLPLYGSVPRGNEAWDDSGYYSYDPDRARELLAESGVPLPATLTTYASTGGPGFSQAVEVMSLIQQNLADVGVTMNVEYVEFTALNRIQSPGYEPGVHGSLQGWSTGADQGYWLERMFGPDQFPPTGVNRGWFIDEDQQLAGIFDQARNAPTEEERVALYRQAAQIIDEGAPWLFLYQDRLPRIFTSDVTGIYETPSLYLDYTSVSFKE